MKASVVPVICSIALTGMLGAGATHWWSVRQLVALAGKLPSPRPTEAVQAKPPAIATPAPVVAPVVPAPAPPAPPVVAKTESGPGKSEREFFSSLVDELKAVRQQNQELRDQVAETNRDLMELQFRVDTHSESFRPLKVTSEPASLQSEVSGVLPPKALPVE
jgi:hypothetical protein